MGQHSNEYMIVTNMYGLVIPLFPVYGIENARAKAAQLSKYHPTTIQDLSTGQILSGCIEVEAIEVA